MFAGEKVRSSSRWILIQIIWHCQRGWCPTVAWMIRTMPCTLVVTCIKVGGRTAWIQLFGTPHASHFLPFFMTLLQNRGNCQSRLIKSLVVDTHILTMRCATISWEEAKPGLFLWSCFVALCLPLNVVELLEFRLFAYTLRLLWFDLCFLWTTSWPDGWRG